MHSPEIPYIVRPMVLRHLPAVIAIERMSFALPWPESAYSHEVTQNELAHYYVLCCRQPSSPSGVETASTSAWRRLKRAVWRPAAPLDDEVLGYGGFWMLVDEAHISTLAVRSDVRRQGLGELMLLGLLEEARRTGALSATLEVRVSNIAARGLYTKYGFEEVGRRKSYYQDNGEDALIMTTPVFDAGSYWQAVTAHRTVLVGRLAAAVEEGCQPA
jgi:ribosomal-protein-alanine N-acetyltransferase